MSYLLVKLTSIHKPHEHRYTSELNQLERNMCKELEITLACETML